VEEFNGKSFEIEEDKIKRKLDFDIKNTRDYPNKKPI